MRIRQDQGCRLECTCGIVVYEARRDVGKWVKNHRLNRHHTYGGPVVTLTASVRRAGTLYPYRATV